MALVFDGGYILKTTASVRNVCSTLNKQLCHLNMVLPNSFMERRSTCEVGAMDCLILL